MSETQLILLQTFAVISVSSSCVVLITWLAFKQMRRKLFMQVIGMISLCDLIGNAPYLTTLRPASNSWQCRLQGFCNLYFYPVGWLWATSLVFMLYSLAAHGKLPLTYRTMHLICWGIPLGLTALMQITNPLGRGETADPGEICSYRGNEEDGFLWHYITYYGLWFFCSGSMIYMHVRIKAIKKSMQFAQTSRLPLLLLSISCLKLYPLSMIVCWLPHNIAVCLNFYLVHNPIFQQFYMATDYLKISQGTCTSLIFFYKSTEARCRWKKLLLENRLVRLFCCTFAKHEILKEITISQDLSVEYGEEATLIDHLKDMVVTGTEFNSADLQNTAMVALDSCSARSSLSTSLLDAADNKNRSSLSGMRRSSLDISLAPSSSYEKSRTIHTHDIA